MKEEEPKAGKNRSAVWWTVFIATYLIGVCLLIVSSNGLFEATDEIVYNVDESAPRGGYLESFALKSLETTPELVSVEEDISRFKMAKIHLENATDNSAPLFELTVVATAPEVSTPLPTVEVSVIEPVDRGYWQQAYVNAMYQTLVNSGLSADRANQWVSVADSINAQCESGYRPDILDGRVRGSNGELGGAQFHHATLRSVLPDLPSFSESVLGLYLDPVNQGTGTAIMYLNGRIGEWGCWHRMGNPPLQ